MQHRKTSLALALLCAALALAGCSGWSSSPPMRGNPLVEPLNLPAVQSRAQQGGGATFTQALTNEYASLATDLSSNAGDWADADYFSRKGLAASRGAARGARDDGVAGAGRGRRGRAAGTPPPARAPRPPPSARPPAAGAGGGGGPGRRRRRGGRGRTIRTKTGTSP